MSELLYTRWTVDGEPTKEEFEAFENAEAVVVENPDAGLERKPWEEVKKDLGL